MEAEITEKITVYWEIIFDKLNHAADLDSISLVCKEFLPVTNSIRYSLAVFSPSVRVLIRLLRRFPHIKKLQLMNFGGDLNKAILEIARSGLNLEELDLSCNRDLPDVYLEKLGSCMKNLKILCCSRSCLTDTDLVRISNLFPQLEELDISESSFPRIIDGKMIAVTDEGVEFMSSNLKRLRRIDISGNQCISDKSLISLSSNCALLRKIAVVDPPQYLQSLKLSNVKISDEFLRSVAAAHIPLTDLALLFCNGYTFTGISSLLHSYRSLKSLALLGAEFLTNEHIGYLSPFLLNLSSIQLHNCPLLSDSAFVTLSERCRLLTRLEIGINDDVLTMIGKKSPGLLHLDLEDCENITEKGVTEVVKCCTRLRYLNLSVCFNVSVDVVELIVNNRPSIRRLMLPSSVYPEEEDQENLLQRGCLVTKDAHYDDLI
ncbi:hypothetical protein RND81_13G174800 [Saponaria officinalis]|uniref:Uncharacterized protein n=1 Tax=Saponaria officinalis TaxID=3572 RepID=A0AAW1H2K2_SAPOF